MLKISPIFKKFTNFTNLRILRNKNEKFSGYLFHMKHTYWEIFKSALVYL